MSLKRKRNSYDAGISIVFLLKRHLVLVYNAEIDLDLYREDRHEERTTESKTDLNLSAGSTYMRVYTVPFVDKHKHLLIVWRIVQL